MANGKDSKAQPSGSRSSASKSEKKSPGFNLGEEIAKRLAATEKDRADQAKRIAAEIQRKAVLAAGIQNGGAPPVNDMPDLLRNMCGF